MTGHWIRALVGALLWIAILGVPVPAALAAGRTVDAHGDGATVYEAEQNAISTALREALPQIVVAERKIQDDELILDRITSSLNGFIEKVQVLSREGDAKKGFSVKLRVTVSESAVESFVQLHDKEPTGVQFGAMLAERDRDRRQRAFRESFIERAFRGYPYRAIDVKLTDARLSQKEPDLILLDVSYQLNQRYIESVMAAARAIACAANDARNPECSRVRICEGEPGARSDAGCVLLGAGRARRNFDGSPGASAILEQFLERHRTTKLGLLARFAEGGTRAGQACADMPFSAGKGLPSPLINVPRREDGTTSVYLSARKQVATLLVRERDLRDDVSLTHADSVDLVASHFRHEFNQPQDTPIIDLSDAEVTCPWLL